MSAETAIPISPELTTDRSTGERVVRNTAMLGAGHAVRLVMGSATTILITDLLGTEYGLLIGAQRFVDFFRLVMMFGLNTLLIRGIARAEFAPGQLLGSVISLRLALGCVFVLLTVVTAIASGYMPEHRWLVWVFVAVAWGYVGVETLTGFCEGHERMDRTAPLPVTRSILMLTGTLIVARTGAGLQGIAIVFLITQMLQLALSFGLARPLLREIRPEVSAPRVRGLLRDGPHYMAVGLAYAALRGTSVVLLTRLSPSAEVAMFGAALNFVDLLFVLPLLAQRAFLPVFSRSEGAKRTDEATAIASNGVYAFSSVLIPAAAGLHMLAVPVVALYPSGEFAAAAPVLRVLALGVVFTCMGSVSATFLTGRGRVSDVLRAYALALPLQVALCLWGIGPLGAVGAALATVSAQGVLCLGLVVRARREGMRLPWPAMLRHTLSAGVMMLALAPLETSAVPVSASMGFLVYATVLLAICPDGSFERILLSRLRKKTADVLAHWNSRS